MGASLDKGTYGEQGAGFFLGTEGYFFIDGPSGAGGHAANAGGFDGAAYNPRTDHLILLDNKAFGSNGNVRSATAIDPAVNLRQNLDALITQAQIIPGLPHRARILALLVQTRSALAGTGAIPPNVQIAVSNFGGNSRGASASLAGRGISFIDMSRAPTPPPPANRVYLRKETVPPMARPAASSGPGAFNTRVQRADALARAAAGAAQTGNDWGVQYGVDRELERLWADIAAALVGGEGALVVVNILATRPRGVIETTISRSVRSAYLLTAPTEAQAVAAWQEIPKLKAPIMADSQEETRLLWFGLPAAR
jgi:hypothetical protein